MLSENLLVLYLIACITVTLINLIALSYGLFKNLSWWRVFLGFALSVTLSPLTLLFGLYDIMLYIKSWYNYKQYEK